MRALPAYMNVAILLRSSGGAHFASMAAIEGYVTACEYTEYIRTMQGQNTEIKTISYYVESRANVGGVYISIS